jgi:putative ABC transport system permease protein
MHDVRLAWRALRGSPALTAAAVLSLALGMGANTAMFSVVDALLLRSLPVPEPHRLVTVSSGFALNHGFKAGAGMSYDHWSRMRERAAPVGDGFAWASGRVDLSPGGEVQPADALFTSGGFFSTLGVPPLLGRTFSVADDVEGGGRDGLVTVISYQLWQRRFGGAGTAIGAVLPVDGVPCTVIGVMPPQFFGIEVGQPFDLVLPLATEPAIRGAQASLHHPSRLMLTAMFRLKPGQSIDAATAVLRSAQADIVGMTGEPGSRPLPAFLKDPYVLVPAASGTSDRSGLRRHYARPLLTVLAVVVLVLLVACVNIANLLLIRAAERRHEMSVRLALGASRWRLARPLLAESLILALLGAATGLVFAVWASRAMVSSLSTPDTRVSLWLSLDGRVLLVTASTAVLTALIFGTGPAFRASRGAPAEALTLRGPGAGSRARIGASLVVVQVALSLVLVAAAGLFLSTLTRLAAIPLGFEPAALLVVDVDTARAHTDQGSRLAFYQQLADAVAAVPGVTRAAGSSISPFSQATRSPLFADPNRVIELVVSPGYFATAGLALRSGRDFDRQDVAGGPRVVAVSEAYARRFLAGRDPLQSIIETGPCRPPAGTCAVVGVVTDAVFGPLRSGARPAMYFPLAQSGPLGPPGRTTFTLSVRSAVGSPASLVPEVGDALRRVHPRLSFSSRPLEQDVEAALTEERLVAVLSGFFAGLGLLLSALGIYGVTAYSTARRRIEIGIRLALGATPLRIVRLVVVRMLILTAMGVYAGIGAAAWASRFISTLLFGIGPSDPTTLAVAAGSLIAVALVASFVPAFRASMTDPAKALRET